MGIVVLRSQFPAPVLVTSMLDPFGVHVACAARTAVATVSLASSVVVRFPGVWFIFEKQSYREERTGSGEWGSSPGVASEGS